MSARTIGGDKAVAGAGSQDGYAAPGQGHGAVRVLGLAAVCAGVMALAAATFVLSYSGIHHLALQAGLTPRLARGYPLIIDAMLVVVLAAVLSLRGAGVPSRLFAWATLVVLLAAAASADALHAAGRKLPDHVAAVTVAVVPWVLVFLAFALLLTMLRYARVRRHGGGQRAAMDTDLDAASKAGDEAALIPPLVSGHDSEQPLSAEPVSAEPVDVATTVLAVPRQPGPATVADDDAASAASAADARDAELAIDSDPGQDDPSSDEAADDDPAMPVFHRMWSEPTPPSGM